MPWLVRAKDDTIWVVAVEPSSRLTWLKLAEAMMFFKLACLALMPVCTCEAVVPVVCAVIRSAFMSFRIEVTLLMALVAVLTTEAPRLRALVTAERAEVSDFMLVEMDQ